MFKMHFYGKWSFMSGVIIGVILAVSIKKCVKKRYSKNIEISSRRYENWFDKQGLRRLPVSWHSTLENFHKRYLLESQYLFNKIKILCIIFVTKESNLNISLATWAKGCNQVKPIIIQTAKRPFPVIKQPKENARWSLLCSTLKGVKLKSIDWIFVANEYTFALLENFRYYVASFDVQKPFYIGHVMKFWGVLYNTKSSAYALNKKALSIFIKRVESTGCSADNAYLNKEDFFLGKILAQLNITPVDTRDQDGFSLFYPNTWEQHLFPSDESFQSSVYSIKCCSKLSIAFQTNNNNKMYTFNYLLYTLKICDSGKNRHIENQEMPEPSEDGMVWKNFLSSRNISYENISSEQYFKIWESLILDPTLPWGVPDNYSLDYHGEK